MKSQSRKKVWVSWSTGKDSAYALHLLKSDPTVEISGLFTTVTEAYGRVAMHSTRETLLFRQAELLGLPVEIVRIPNRCKNEEYELRMAKLIEKAKANDVAAMAFGDLFLTDIRAYRERMLATSGIESLFPLWQQPTKSLATKMIQAGIKAYLTCIDPSKLEKSFAGREFNAALLNDLPPNVDPCGENGEFHTFVFESPDFRSPIQVQLGDVVEREGFIFADILPMGLTQDPSPREL